MLPLETGVAPVRKKECNVAISTPPIRILVCDDDKAICDYVETLLTRDGHDVKTVSDPLLVEDEVKNGHFQMLILDRMMPKMDGIEVLRRVRKADNDISVIMFTGFPSLDSAVAAMKLAADDYLKKPFNAEELREVIDRIAKKKGIVRSPEEQLHNVIGETIRRLRKEKDLTLKQMAHRTGLSVSLLSQIERAESSASIPSLYKIATALGARVSDLFGGY
jgi:two-component system OmpR family response regulator